MRGAIISVIILIFCVNLASAEISIGQYKYPTIIIVPLISIIISVIILLVLASIAIGSRKKELMQVWKTHAPKIQMPTKFFAGKARRHVKPVETVKLQGEEAEYLKEINRFKHHLNDLPPEEAFNVLSELTKRFFKEMLHISYQCTYNELAEELTKRGKKKGLVDICNKFSEIKYSDEPLSQEKLKKFADEIESMLKTEHIKPVQKAGATTKEIHVSKAFAEKREGLFKSVLDVFIKPKKRTIEREEMLKLIKNETDALKRDMEIAQQTYHNILSSYYKLPKEERKEVYNKLISFYQDVNKLMFSSFYSEKGKKELDVFAEKLARLKEEEEKHLKARELKPREEKKEAREELERLSLLEKEARERLKAFGESVIEKAIQPEVRAEPAKQIQLPVHEALQKTIRMHEGIAKTPPLHKAHAQKTPIPKIAKTYIDELKSPSHKRKIETLNKEAKELVERLEKLQKSYIG